MPAASRRPSRSATSTCSSPSSTGSTGRTRLWVTEYGYQTNPPDRIVGVSWSKQAVYLTQATTYARKHPRIDIFLWFLLRDEQRLSGRQSGLMTVTGMRKPSFNAFRRAALLG